MQLIDSHSHIDFNDFDTDRSAAIKRATECGVSDIIVSSTTADRWHLVKKVCDDNPETCHPAYGLHPMFLSDHQLEKNEKGINFNIDKLKSWVEENTTVAVGEIGLDFYIEEADEKHRRVQIELFIKQLEIAAECKLPVIIHARKSLDIVLKHLRTFPTISGSIHSFSGSEQQAKQLIDLGFYLGFGGPITYSRATRLHKLIQQLPLESMLVETDSPDQPDANHHSQRNEPAFITQVIDKIAELREVDCEMVAQETTKNAFKLFKL